MQEIKLKLDRNYFLMVILLGVLANFVVFSANGYLMPVKTDININSNMHFSYQENNEIKLWLLSDIIGGEINNYIFLFSLGDVLITLGFIGLFSSQIKLTWLVYKEKINKFLNSFKRSRLEKEIRFNPL
jgi:hypothetical protein